MNPYVGKTFWGFLSLLFSRLFSAGELAQDEIQLLTFITVGIASAFLGTFLVLRRGAMLANALSHTILLGLVASFWVFGYAAVLDFKILGLSALISGLVSAGLIHILQTWLGMQREGAIALVFTALFSLGVTLSALLTKNLHLGIESITGSGDLLTLHDLRIGAGLLVSTIGLGLLCYKSLVVSTFDATLATSMGVRTRLIHIALMCQSAACIVGGFRCVGLVMVLAFFIAPVLAAQVIARHMRDALWIAALFVAVCSIVGCALSRHLLTTYALPVSTGALVATLLSAVTLACLALKKAIPFIRAKMVR